MTTTKTIRAFLAARYPAAYTEIVILQRCNRSGMLDDPASMADIHEALVTLARRHKHVDLLIDSDGTQAWSATPAGVAEWTLDGSPIVGG